MGTALRRAFLLSALAVVSLRAEPLKLSGETETVAGQYIVLGEGELKGIAAVHGEVLRELRLENFPSGWVVRMSPESAELVARDGYTVIPNFVIRLPGYPAVRVKAEESAASWHLDRDDQRTLPLDGLYRYLYTGAGVRAYVMDDGIFRSSEFGSRREEGKSFVQDGKGPAETCGQVATHGTGVASILGGERYGVARGVTIVPVRIFACDGTSDGPALYGGWDWILSDAKKHPESRAVVNMSFASRGAGTSQDPVLRKLAEAGVVLVDAAGNWNEDTCTVGPAASRHTITAGGSARGDRRWLDGSTFGSNFGKCLDLFAPAREVSSAGGRDYITITGSVGTSSAAPQVAGHAAQLLEQFPDASPAKIRRLLLANATPGVLSDIGAGSPNLLLYTGAFRETATRFIPRWFPAESRFTLQLRLDVPGGGRSPAEEVRLFRGPKQEGQCQGQPFARASLKDSEATVTIRGWKQAPAFVCAETSLGTVFDRSVRTLNQGTSRP